MSEVEKNYQRHQELSSNLSNLQENLSGNLAKVSEEVIALLQEINLAELRLVTAAARGLN